MICEQSLRPLKSCGERFADWARSVLSGRQKRQTPISTNLGFNLRFKRRHGRSRSLGTTANLVQAIPAPNEEAAGGSKLRFDLREDSGVGLEAQRNQHPQQARLVVG